MKKLCYVLMLATGMFVIQSCGSNSQNDSKESADSTNAAKDSAAKDTSYSAGAGMATGMDDAKFATTAANGGMTEVALSKLALQKATNAQVKDFASMMVKDHSKANEELMALAKSKNITLPATMDNDSQKKHDELAAKTGADFDKAYVSAMVDGHDKTVSMFEDASKDLKDPDLKAFVDKTLPTLRMHKDAIHKISDSMK